MWLSEISQADKDTHCMVSLIYGIKKWKQTNVKNRNRLTDIENKLVFTRIEKEWERAIKT